MKRKQKTAVYILLLIAVNILVIFSTAKIIGYIEGSHETARAKDFMKNADLSEEYADKELAGMIFEYKGDYTFSDGEVRSIDGSETYYWDGKKFIPASEFLK